MRPWATCVLVLAACGRRAEDERAPAHGVAIDASGSPDAASFDAAPRRFAARAELDPTPGSNLKTVSFLFLQTEGELPSLASAAPITGVPPGRYHFVIHEGRDCGEGAIEAGAAWPGSIVVDIPRKAPALVELARVDVHLDGDRSIAGHTLALHADARGKPGRVLGCGAIFARSPVSP